MATAKGKGETEGTALVEQPPTPTALATYDPRDRRGREELTEDDAEMPRLAICQGTSPQKNEDDGKYIPDLKEGDLFNSLTQQVYGRGPVNVAVVAIKRRAMQFGRDAAGKQTKEVIDRDVPWDDPRCQWTDGPNNTRNKPIATQIYDYYVWLPATHEPAVISMSVTKMKIARAINGLLRYRSGPTWLSMFQVGVAREKDGDHNYFNFKVRAGDPTPLSALKACEEFFAQLQVATPKIHEDGGVTDDAPVRVVDADPVPF